MSSSTSTSRGNMMRSYSRNNSSTGASSGMNSENLPPRTLARVARDVRDMLKCPPEGVRLVVDLESGMPASLAELTAEIEGPAGTPYENKFFQLKVLLSADFPTSPPRGFFLTKIYHPNIDMSTGAICVNTLKKDWTATTSFSHVLSIIRCLLIVPFPESSLNDEAGKLFMESYEEYARRARLMANVHGRPRPFSEYGVGSPQSERSGNSIKCSSISSGSSVTGSNENEDDRVSRELKVVGSSSKSHGIVLQQSNSMDNPNKTSLVLKNNGCSKTASKSAAVDKKSKKKSLKRL